MTRRVRSAGRRRHGGHQSVTTAWRPSRLSGRRHDDQLHPGTAADFTRTCRWGRAAGLVHVGGSQGRGDHDQPAAVATGSRRPTAEQTKGDDDDGDEDAETDEQRRDDDCHPPTGATASAVRDVAVVVVR